MRYSVGGANVVRVKAVGETDPVNPLAQSTVQCPECLEEQTLLASTIASITHEPDESSQVNRP